MGQLLLAGSGMHLLVRQSILQCCLVTFSAVVGSVGGWMLLTDSRGLLTRALTSLRGALRRVGLNGRYRAVRHGRPRQESDLAWTIRVPAAWTTAVGLFLLAFEVAEATSGHVT